MVISIVFLLSAFIFTVHKIQNRNVSSIIERKLDSAKQLFNAQLESDAGMMSAVLIPFLSSERMKSALSAKNRNLLLEYGKPLFEQLRSEHNITHLYFTGPDRINILRVHNPEMFGDTISRFTILEAEKTKRISYGIELGRMGTFTLRVVVPCYEKDQLIGYVELGEEIDHLVQKLSKILNVDAYLAIEKKFIDRKEWESAMAILGRQANWSQFPTAVIVSRNQKYFPEELAYYIPEEHHVRGVVEISLEKDGRYYRSRFMHLENVSGQEVGEMIIVYDVTEMLSSGKYYTFAVALIYLTVGGLLFFLFYGYLARVERTLTTAQAELIEWNKTLEEKIEEKTKELNESHEKAIQSSKMSAIGQLAGGVAHDFNNMLSVINGYSEMLLREIVPSDPKYAHIKEINKAGERSADLTRQLLAFARKQPIAPKVLDLNDTVAGMLKMLQRLIGENSELILKPAANLWKIKMDPSQLDQILTNLLVNARDAISGAGKIAIETGKEELAEAFCKTHPDSLPGKYVVLSVSDNGCGMSKETIEHIFEPFFTTKAVGEGTGLGLATVFGIVKQNNGFIDVYSEPGKGTTYKIYLPRHESENVVKDEILDKPEIITGTETVLLVEDEKSLLQFAKALLERMGYTVLTANNPTQAIKIAGEYKGDIHLLMTDVIMPEMSGRDLKEKINEIRSDIKYLFMSGYTADIMSHNGVIDEGINFLQKPFTAEELSVKLREVLYLVEGKHADPLE